METFLDGWAPSLRPLIRVMTYESFKRGHSLPRGTYIFSDLERLSAVTRAVAEQAHRRLSDADDRPVILNDPRGSLVRFELLRALKEDGTNDFRPYRLTETRIPQRFPVFIREEDKHSGTLTPLLHDQRQLDRAIARLYLRHGGLDNLLMIEFCDTSDHVGIFRKYGVFLVGSRLIPKHLFFSRQWMVKGSDLVEAEHLREEADFLETNPHEDALRGVFRSAGIAYGRIDYGIRNGRIQVWEINTNPMILGPPERMKPERLPFKVRLSEQMAKAFGAIDSPVPVSAEATGLIHLSEVPPIRMWTRVRGRAYQVIRSRWGLRFGGVDRIAEVAWRPVIALLKRTKWSGRRSERPERPPSLR